MRTYLLPQSNATINPTDLNSCKIIETNRIRMARRGQQRLPVRSFVFHPFFPLLVHDKKYCLHSKLFLFFSTSLRDDATVIFCLRRLCTTGCKLRIDRLARRALFGRVVRSKCENSHDRSWVICQQI